MRRTLARLIFLPLVAFCALPATAQEPLQDKDKAVLAFDIYMERLTSSETAKASGADPAMMNMGNKINPNDMRRIFGAVSAPASVAEMDQAQQGGGPLPMNFFVRLQFKSEELAKDTYDKLGAEGKSVTLGGKQYYRPPDDGTTPPNMLVHMSAADTMEMGTDGFILQESRNLFTPNLLASWKKMPKAGIRIAADLDGARKLINEGLEMAKAGGGIPMPAMPALALVENSSGIRIAMDFSSENMFWLTLTGKDAGATNTVKATLDGFLAMASGFGAQGLAAIPDEDLKRVAGEILAALKATADGNDVNIVLPRPEGFEAAVGKAAQMAMGGMFGGPGGPPPGAFEAEPAGAGADPFGGDPFGN